MNKQKIINELRDIADLLQINYGDDEKAYNIRELADILQKESNSIQDIVKLNEERYGLEFNPGKEYDKLKEELDELLEAIANQDVNEMIDAWNDIIVIAIGSIRKAGYDPEKTLNEVVKEISSREQDEEQKKRWLNGNKKNGEKWLKNRNQDPKTLYKANFEKTKIKGE